MLNTFCTELAKKVLIKLKFVISLFKILIVQFLARYAPKMMLDNETHTASLKLQSYYWYEERSLPILYIKYI